MKYYPAMWKYMSKTFLGLPDGPVVKNSLSKAGDSVSSPCQETKIPRAMGQPSPWTAIREAHTLQQRASTAKRKNKKFLRCGVSAHISEVENEKKGRIPLPGDGITDKLG